MSVVPFWMKLQRALDRQLPGQVTYLVDWKKVRTGRWLGPKSQPVALLLHHTAGAATESTDPKAAGNRKGANDAVIRFVQHHYAVPAANFTLDRDGTVYVHSAYPVWHAGLGTFRSKQPWVILEVPNDMGNRYMLGVEIVSRGKKKDFTVAQKRSLARLQEACGMAADWPVEKRMAKVRHPRHKDWTDRKIDILYEQDEIQKWMDV